VIGREGFHLAGVMAHQAILATLNRMGYQWDRCGFCGWRFCGWGGCGRACSSLTRLVTVQTGLLRPALVIGWKGLHLAKVMAYQTVSPAFNGMGNQRNRRCCFTWLGCVHSSHVDLMAVETKLVGLKGMIPGERFDRTLSVANQAIFLAFLGMRH
jgi:hypothetical protein